jgi:uncharacterized membrane protein
VATRRALKAIFGAFLGTMIYVCVIVSRMRDGFVPGVSLWLVGILVFGSVLLFIAFVSNFVQRLRPAPAVAAVVSQGRPVIERLDPRPSSGQRPADGRFVQERLGQSTVIMTLDRSSDVALNMQRVSAIRLATALDAGESTVRLAGHPGRGGPNRPVFSGLLAYSSKKVLFRRGCAEPSPPGHFRPSS